MLAAFGDLPALPDEEPALQRLAAAGVPMAAVTNSSADTARSLLASTGLDEHFATSYSPADVTGEDLMEVVDGLLALPATGPAGTPPMREGGRANMPPMSASSMKAVTRGVLAGAVGTLAMDLLWYARYRRGGGDDGFLDWELSSTASNFEEAGAPAQVGKRIVRTVLGKDLPDRSAGLTNNIVHWSTGSQWGALYGLAAEARSRSSPADGLVLGPVAWGSAYALLGAVAIYEPIWNYDKETLAKDLSAHLVFGVATAAAYRAMRGRS